jgi:uncharacterized membrane protein YfcA
MWITVVLLGLTGGVVSTLVGFGAGMILAIALALTVSPLAALAVASLALLSGSIHRVILFRHELRLSDTYQWALGIGVGSVVGGLLVHHLPDCLLRAAFVGAAVVALLPRGAHDGRWARPRWRLLLPAGGVIGFIGAGTAGVGPIASSTLMATGHTGERYIALMAVTGVALNMGRVVGYGSSGVLESSWLWASAAAGIGLFAGNILGRRLRRCLADRRMSQLERAVPWTCLALAMLGLMR